MTYRIYTIMCGEQQIIAEGSAKQIKRAYGEAKAAGLGARVSVDGRQMTIAEADKWAGCRLSKKTAEFQ